MIRILSGDYDNNTEKLDDYTVVDVLLRYKRNIGQTELTAFFRVANLFDEEYSTHGTDNQWWGGENTYYPSPGRKFLRWYIPQILIKWIICE